MPHLLAEEQASANIGEGVETHRQELIDITPKYDLIRDILEGEFAVKAAGTKYLPVPNDDVLDTSERYKAYKLRAVLYNVTHRTVEGLVGQLFLRDPVIEVPDILQHVVKDANAANMTLIQMAKMACNHVVPYGRGGIFTDYSSVNQAASLADLRAGIVRPTINFYKPWHIINWDREKIDSRNLLSFVVLMESKTIKKEFVIEHKVQYRVLRLIRDEFGELCTKVEVWFKSENGEFEIIESYIICDAKGAPLGEIPFDFTGSDDNDDTIDEPPIFDTASLNMAHYRNSADFEESCFMLGQPTPWVTGLTEHWAKNVLKGEIFLGSRTVIMLGENTAAGLLQVEPNTLAREAMDHKEKQMRALGAKLVQERIIEATATEVELQNASEDSVLTTIGKNVTTVFQKALERAAAYIGQPIEDIKFKLNDNFDLTTMTAEETRIGAELWANFHAITTVEMRELLRRSGLASVPDEEYLSQIVKDKTLKDQLGMNDTQEGSDNRSTVSTAE